MDFTTFLILIVAIITLVLPSLFKKFYKGKTPLFMSFVSCVVSALFFLFLSGFNLSFDSGLIVYAVWMASAFGIAVVFSTLAIQCGYLSLSGLIMSLSLVLPTLYGVIFLHNPVNLFFWIGMAALIASLVLVNVEFKKKKSDINAKNLQPKKKFNFKWLIFITLGAVGNGFSSISQTAQQTAYAGDKKNELMILALTIASIAILIASLIMERKSIKESIKGTLIWGSSSGLATGVLNYSVMLLVGLMDAALLFPLISGGSLLITFVLAMIIFKERYKILQYVGFVLGLLSVVLLNL